MAAGRITTGRGTAILHAGKKCAFSKRGNRKVSKESSAARWVVGVCVKTLNNGGLEGGEGGVRGGGQARVFDELPEPLKQIEVGGIGGRKHNRVLAGALHLQTGRRVQGTAFRKLNVRFRAVLADLDRRSPNARFDKVSVVVDQRWHP